MAHVIYFLDGPEAGTVRRLDKAPGREWRIASIPRDLQVTAGYHPPCPNNLFVGVVVYELLKLPDGWPSSYWKDSEYVAKVTRFTT